MSTGANRSNASARSRGAWGSSASVVCGALLAGALSDQGALEPPTALRRAVERGELAPRPDVMGFRDLRRLPGIGHGRAEAIVMRRRAARSDEGPLCWSDVPGIGERTEARIRRWLDDRGRADTEAFFRPYRGPVRAPPVRAR